MPNVQDVEQVTVQAGQTAWIMAQNTNVFAVRIADPMGIVSTKYFRFEAWDPAAAETPFMWIFCNKAQGGRSDGLPPFYLQ